MTNAGDLVTETVDDIKRRLEELKPRYEEYIRLERVVGVLHAAGQRIAGLTGRSVPFAAPVKKPKKGDNGRAARGSRAEEAYKIIRGNPGIEIKDIAQRMGIQPNYLYRVTARLERDGRIVKKGGGFRSV